MKLTYDFHPTEKLCMWRAVSQDDSGSEHCEPVLNILRLDGSTVLWPDEARYLAEVIRPDYRNLAERIESHPGLQPEDQRLRAQNSPTLPGLEGE